MAAEASTHNTLEDLLCDEEIAEPLRLELSLLKEITNNFSEEQVIGSGAYGVVYKALLGDSFIAVKLLGSFSEIEDRTFEREVDCLVRVKHRNIVGFVGYCAESHWEVVWQGARSILAESQKRLLCFEYMRNGSLRRHLITGEPCRLPWHVCYQIVKGMCQGFYHLHEKHIIHLDLKPDNILLDDDMVPKIADFGLSRLLGVEKSRTVTQKILGSMGYMAPEYMFHGSITIKSDIYSLGVIIMQMLTGSGHAAEPMIENALGIWRCRLESETSQRHTPLEIGYQQVKACIEISTSCTEHKPENRPVTGDIIRRLGETVDASGVSTSPKRSRVLPLPASAKGTGGAALDKRENFQLEATGTTGAKWCMMLPSRSLKINWGDTPRNWRWISLPDSRFAECAELLEVYWFVVSGEVAPKELSAGTGYAAYLVYKLVAGGVSGLEGGQTSSIRLYGERVVATSRVSLDPEARAGGADVTYPVARGDGWMELRLGEFANHGEMLSEQAVIVDIRDEDVRIKKSGIIVEGMEFRANS